jgi:hypothetical protein
MWTNAGRLAAVVAFVLLPGFVVRSEQPQSDQKEPAKLLVVDVTVQGNRKVPTSTITALAKLRPGVEYTQTMAQEDVARLMDTRQFSSVRVWIEEKADGRVIVHFLVTEFNPNVREVIYKNAHHLKPAELDELIGITKGTPLNPARNRQACLAIQQRYKEKGRLFASVVLEEGADPGDSRVVFNIAEGPIVKVHQIRFTGNAFASDALLRVKIDSNRPFLGLMSGAFPPQVADHDVHKLEDYYKRHGFRDVKVARELVYDENCRTVDLVFHINEGTRFCLEQEQLDNLRSLGREPPGEGALRAWALIWKWFDLFEFEKDTDVNPGLGQFQNSCVSGSCFSSRREWVHTLFTVFINKKINGNPACAAWPLRRGWMSPPDLNIWLGQASPRLPAGESTVEEARMTDHLLPLPFWKWPQAARERDAVRNCLLSGVGFEF